MKHLLITTIATVLMVGCGNPQPSDTEYRAEYRKNMITAKDMISVGGTLAIKVSNEHSKRWRDATRDEYSDLKDAVDFSIELHQKAIDSLNASRQTLQPFMSQALSSPPNGFESAHSKLVSVYATYIGLVDAAISPSGSLISYEKSINRLREDFSNGMNELTVLIPN